MAKKAPLVPLQQQKSGKTPLLEIKLDGDTALKDYSLSKDAHSVSFSTSAFSLDLETWMWSRAQ